jgi:hypothetical protein
MIDFFWVLGGYYFKKAKNKKNKKKFAGLACFSLYF